MAVFQPVFNNESSDTGKTTLNRWLFFDFIAILVGVIGGLSATLFQYSIDLIQEFFNDIVLPVITVQIYGVNIGNFLLPIMGGLLVGPITYYLCKDAKGDGISEIEKSVAMHRGIMQKQLGPLKLLVSAITIGSGGSAGREGPMGQIGSGFASLIFYKVKLTTHERRLLLVCGLVAGLSALYDAPVGAALFGFEVLLHSFDIFISIPVFLASIIGYAVSNY